MAKHLYDIMGPSATFRWGTEQENALDELRQKPMEAPVLAYPNSEDLFILDSDASIMLLELNCYRFRMEWNG